MIPPDKQNQPTNSIHGIFLFHNIKVSAGALHELTAKRHMECILLFHVPFITGLPGRLKINYFFCLLSFFRRDMMISTIIITTISIASHMK